MTFPFLGEFLGTAVLIFLGNGVVANVLLRKSKGEGSGWIVITAGWAFAVLAGVFTAIACGSRDAHLNPAVTVGFALATGDSSKIAPYLLAQVWVRCLARCWCGCTISHTGGRHLTRQPSLPALRRAPDSQPTLELSKRTVGDVHSRFCSRRDFLEECERARTPARNWAVPRSESGVGNWPVARGHNRLCD